MTEIGDRQMEGEKVIRISVRNLVEFILREGDIDNRTAGMQDKEVMQLEAEFTGKFRDRWDRIIMQKWL